MTVASVLAHCATNTYHPNSQAVVPSWLVYPTAYPCTGEVYHNLLMENFLEHGSQSSLKGLIPFLHDRHG